MDFSEAKSNGNGNGNEVHSSECNGKAILWAVPRSISTAFYRAMMNKKSVKTVMEPYSNAYYFGEQRVSRRYSNVPLMPGASFKDVRNQYTQVAAADGEVFVKDMAYYIMGGETNGSDAADLVPTGFVHTFLIRDPARSIKSLYKMSVTSEVTGWTYFESAEAGFKELWNLYEFVRKNIDPDPLVIDAEDLTTKPEAVLRFYCERTGIKYVPEMLHWDPQDGADQEFGTWKPWYEGALSSNTFMKRRVSIHKQKSIELPQLVEKSIEDNEPFYQKFKAVAVSFA